MLNNFWRRKRANHFVKVWSSIRYVHNHYLDLEVKVGSGSDISLEPPNSKLANLGSISTSSLSTTSMLCHFWAHLHFLEYWSWIFNHVLITLLSIIWVNLCAESKQIQGKLGRSRTRVMHIAHRLLWNFFRFLTKRQRQRVVYNEKFYPRPPKISS